MKLFSFADFPSSSAQQYGPTMKSRFALSATILMTNAWTRLEVSLSSSLRGFVVWWSGGDFICWWLVFSKFLANELLSRGRAVWVLGFCTRHARRRTWLSSIVLSICFKRFSWCAVLYFVIVWRWRARDIEMLLYRLCWDVFVRFSWGGLIIVVFGDDLVLMMCPRALEWIISWSYYSIAIVPAGD